MSQSTGEQRISEECHWYTHSFDQQTDVVTLDRPAVHGGTGVDPLHNWYKKTKKKPSVMNAEQTTDYYSDYS